MKKKYIIGILIFIFIFTFVNIYISKFILLQSESGYTFKYVDKNLYKVMSGSNYNGLICDFTNTNELVFKDEIYKYTLNGYKGNYSLDIYYPDGGYTKYSDVTHAEVGSNTKYDKQFITAAIIAIKLLPSPRNIFITLLVELIGIILLICPKGIYNIFYGWRYKNLEPSDVYLLVSRISGLICILVGIYVIVNLNFLW